MSPSLADRVPFAKIVTVLAVIFGISLGLCGLTYAIGNRVRGDGTWLIGVGMLELAAILLSAIGLVITVIVWLVSTAAGNFSPHASDPQKLFDPPEDGPAPPSHEDDRGDR